MKELELDLALVSETWLRNDCTSKTMFEDLEDRDKISVIRKDREAERAAGGVAIFANSEKIELSKCQLPKSRFQVVAAIGRRRGQRRKMLVICIYIPPWYKADESKECLEHLEGLIAMLTKRYRDPYILVGGDFNERRIGTAIRGSKNIKVVNTPPTRGNKTLDIIACSFTDCLFRAGVTDPIFNSEGTETDHKTVYASFDLPRVPQYSVQKYSYQRETEAGKKKFGELLAETDFSTMFSSTDVDEKVEIFQDKMTALMASAFPVITNTRKSSEPPWMSMKIRNEIRIRRAVFRKFGRNEHWHKLKDRTDKMIKDRRSVFEKNLKEKLLTNPEPGNFYKCV